MDAASTPPYASPMEDSSAARGAAVWVVIGSGLAALILGSGAIALVREQLHIACSMGAPGSEGADTWTCSDGIGYLGVAVTLGGMWFLTALLGTFAAGVIRHDATARTVLVLLAGLSTAWVLGFTWYGSSELVLDEYAPMSGQEYWQAAVGRAAIACVAGMAAAVGGLFLRGRLIRVANVAAALGLVVAAALQPGLSINTIPAAGLLVAAAVRATIRPAQPDAIASAI
ncbi:MAG: hypothetical protein ACTHON_12285 [Humibacter sp.]